MMTLTADVRLAKIAHIVDADAQTSRMRRPDPSGRFLLPDFPEATSPALRDIIDEYKAGYHAKGLTSRWEGAAERAAAFVPRSVADLATKLILAIHYRDPTGSDEHLGIDAPEPSADRLAAEMELDCLDHILAMVPPAPANAAEWAAAEAKLLQADTALDALPDGYTDQDVNELSEIRSDAIDTILALPAETAAQAVRKLELAMFDESAVLTRVDHPALLAEAKRLIGRAA